MKTLLFILIAVCSAAAFAQDSAGSLWNDRARNPLADRTARKVGDVLTVLVAESSAASSTAATKGSKSSTTNIEPGVGIVLRAIIPGLSTKTEFDSQGQGSTTRSGLLSARLTVLVKQVLPNGNLVIEGTRLVHINKENQMLILTGIVRPDDIRADNTILSEFIAQADIRYEGSGTVGDRQRKGIITRILDWLF